jgi:hypothetical protein
MANTPAGIPLTIVGAVILFIAIVGRESEFKVLQIAARITQDLTLWQRIGLGCLGGILLLLGILSLLGVILRPNGPTPQKGASSFHHSATTTSSSAPPTTTTTQSLPTTTATPPTYSIPQSGQGKDPIVTLIPDSGTVGTSVRAIMTGFAPSEKLSFSFQGFPEGNYPMTNSSGAVEVDFVIPSNFANATGTAIVDADAEFGPDAAEANFTLTG